jgi:hypothetical protein
MGVDEQTDAKCLLGVYTNLEKCEDVELHYWGDSKVYIAGVEFFTLSALMFVGGNSYYSCLSTVFWLISDPYGRRHAVQIKINGSLSLQVFLFTIVI